MHTAYPLAAIIMTLVALALVLTPLFRARFMAEHHLSDLRNELRALNEAKAAGQLEDCAHEEFPVLARVSPGIESVTAGEI
jgi:hypothetical protein